MGGIFRVLTALESTFQNLQKKYFIFSTDFDIRFLAPREKLKNKFKNFRPYCFYSASAYHFQTKHENLSREMTEE